MLDYWWLPFFKILMQDTQDSNKINIFIGSTVYEHLVL